jgi:hypothetical protein
MTASWRLPKIESEYWLSCEYGGTSAVVSMALARTVSRCEVSYDTRFSRPVATGYRCFG